VKKKKPKTKDKKSKKDEKDEKDENKDDKEEESKDELSTQEPEPEPEPEHQAPKSYGDDPNVLKSEIDDIRKSVVSMSVGQPGRTSTIVKEWLEQPAPAPPEPEEESDSGDDGDEE